MNGRPLAGLRPGTLVVPLLVVLVAAMLVVPVPAPLLDALIVFNITASLVTLLVSLETSSPLQFSALPTLLLLLTLLRLALNVSSTRLILLTGNPGTVIHQFGQFVVGGNAVAGFVVFAILLVIQFVVVTKGAERVTEVAARFTLDAMPGKQLAIDADLGAGLINESEARARRQDVEREADFYGAMDGASKFVKGDAIAGLIIAVINLAGGFIVGMLQQGLGAAEALSHFALLTVGDGLVTQIPALLVSTATGIIATRAASEGGLGPDLLRQLFANPRVLYTAGGAMGILGLVPGLPHWPFLLLGALALGAGYAAARPAAAPAMAPAVALATASGRTATAAAAPDVRSPAGEDPGQWSGLLQVDPLELELGIGLLSLSDPDQGGDLLERVAALRRQVAGELGLVLPYVRVRDNLALPAGCYAIKLRGVQVAGSELLPGSLLALHPSTPSEPVPGIETRDPAFDLPALWITPADRASAQAAGYSIIEPAAVLITHLSEVVRTHAPELLGRQEAKLLIEAVRGNNPALIEELTPGLLSLGEIQRVLQNLLREGVSIRDGETICDALAGAAPQSRDPDLLTERVRYALRRAIGHALGLGPGPVRALVLAPAAEQRLSEALQSGDGGRQFALLPDEARNLVQSLRDGIAALVGAGQTPLLVAPATLRSPLRRLIESLFPRLVVLSYAELDRRLQLEAAGVIEL